MLARALRVTPTIYDLKRADARSGIFNSLASARAGGLVVRPDSFIFDQEGSYQRADDAHAAGMTGHRVDGKGTR